MAQFRNVPITLATFASAAVLLISITAPASASPSSPSDPPLSSATTAVRAQVTNPDTNRTYTPSGTASKVDLNASSGDPIVAAYWTPERMKSAIPADTPTSTAEVDRQIDELKQQVSANEPLTDGSSPVAATSTTITPQAAPPVTNFSKTNGKVFFHNQTDGKDYVCSGSSINSDSKRLVVTAGHCVYGAPGNDGTPIGYSHRATTTAPRMAPTKLPRSARSLTGSTTVNPAEDSTQTSPSSQPTTEAPPKPPS